jgi:putative ABC transport system substrate-binding protein
VIVANGPALPNLKAATTTVPIVFSTASDPIESGLVTSLNRPGGNITGVTNLNVQLAAKRLELMHELVPTAVNVSFLVNPDNVKTAQAFARDAQAAAETLGVKLNILNASNERELNTVIETLAKHQTRGLIIAIDPFFNDQSTRLAALTKERAIPPVFQFREFAAAGGLMSYGGSLPDSWRLAGVYAGRILKGEMPADLQVQQSTKAELIINLKTAKALGLTVPLPLLARADEVIE